MKKEYMFVTLTLTITLMARGQVVQHAFLKDGSVLHGYVRQAVGGRLTFCSDSATIVVPGESVEIEDKTKAIGQISPLWQKWAGRSDAFEGTGNERTLALSDITFKKAASVPADSKGKYGRMFASDLIKKGSIGGVRILERGAFVKFLQLEPDSYTFTLDDIEQIKTDRRPRNCLSGINCIYQLRSGQTFEGEVAGETLNTLSLYMDDGSVRSLNINDVVRYTYRPVNPNQDIFAQSPLVSVVQTKDGGQVRGIITEENYSSNQDEENYVIIQQETGEKRRLTMTEVEALSKEKNARYSPISDIILQKGQVTVNRRELPYVGTKEHGKVVTLDCTSISDTIVIGAGRTMIAVEYRADNTDAARYFLVRLTEATMKKQTKLGFLTDDLMTVVCRPQSICTSVNQTTKAEYSLAPGCYALYDADNHRAIPFIVRLNN